MTSAAHWTADEVAIWAPPERLTPTEWADRYRVLDAAGAEPGRFRSAKTPYAREWMDNAARPWVRQTTIIAGTQMGKTESVNNVLAWSVVQDPGPAMFVVPRNVDVTTFQQRRLLPMISATPELAAEMTDRVIDSKKREVQFKRSILYIRSAQSPADLASVPARYMFLDEVDKYPPWSGREAAPIDLARERQKNFWNSCCYVVTTPTTRDQTGWGEFLDGDRRRYWVPCPFCKTPQLLKWAQVKWDEGLTAREIRRDRSAVYRCEKCTLPIPDSAKPGMLEAGVWVPEAIAFEDWVRGGLREKDRESHRSYQIWSAYSPWVEWWKLASQFLRMRGKPESLMNWTNSWLAEVWDDRVEAPTEDSVTRGTVVGSRLGGVPAGVLLATAGVDVQKDGLWVVVRGWGWDEESWLLFAGKVENFDQLDDLLFRRSWCERGTPGVRCGFIDSRYRRDEVLDWVRRRPAMRMAVGVDRTAPLDFTTSKLERHPKTGQPLEHSMLVWSITVHRFKDLLAARMQKPENWHFPEDTPHDYRVQIASEHKVRVRRRSRSSDVWVVKPGSDANHCWDAEVYAVASARLIGVETLRRSEQGKVVPPSSAPIPKPKPATKPQFPRLSK